MTRQNLSIALTGSGGSGVMTTGSMLLEVAAHAGWYGFMGAVCSGNSVAYR